MGAMQKDPKKFVKVCLEQLGAEIIERDKYGNRWKLPDDYRVYVRDNLSMGAAHAVVKEAQLRIGHQSRPWAAGVKAAGHPRLDLEKVVASEHAKDRLKLMRSQHRIDMRDVLYALRLPEKVLWSPRHESWAWVRGDIAVPVAFPESGAQVITTILWASDELWVSNPRPEKRN